MAWRLIIVSAQVTPNVPQAVTPEELINRLSEAAQTTIAREIDFKHVAVVDGHAVGAIHSWRIRMFERSGQSGTTLIPLREFEVSNGGIVPILTVEMPDSVVLISEDSVDLFMLWCRQVGISLRHYTYDGVLSLDKT